MPLQCGCGSLNVTSYKDKYTEAVVRLQRGRDLTSFVDNSTEDLIAISS